MTPSRVELIHFEGCPHVGRARENLRSALSSADRKTEWTEWDVHDEQTPDDRRGFPSPTVLVDGEPVDGEALSEAASACRTGGAPDVDAIRRALKERG